MTDGSVGIGPGSLKHSLQTYQHRDSVDAKFPLPFPFPCKLHILCVANPGDADLKSALPLYQQLVDINNQVRCNPVCSLAKCYPVCGLVICNPLCGLVNVILCCAVWLMQSCI